MTHGAWRVVWGFGCGECCVPCVLRCGLNDVWCVVRVREWAYSCVWGVVVRQLNAPSIVILLHERIVTSDGNVWL